MKSYEYLAGLFDGEGSFSIQVGLRHYKDGKPSAHFNPSMSVNLYYGSSVLNHYVDAFGGTIYPYQKNGEPAGQRWHLGKRETVLSAAYQIMPYLEIKKAIAQNFITALELFPEPGVANRKKGERVWDYATSIKVAEIALALNPARSRKSNKTLEILDELKAVSPLEMGT